MSTPTPKSSSFFRKLGDRLSCRQVLNVMVLTGFMFNYMLRVNLTIAIVAMVKTNKTNITVFDNGSAIDNDLMSGEDEGGGSNKGPVYDWNPYLQNLILGCFFWGYICTELPGGRLAEIIGSRRVFGYSMGIASLLTLLTPLACHLGYVAVIIVRILLGFLLGATWPAIPPMIAKWIPPMERSKFMANMMASSLGAALTVAICGFLITSFGWPSVFYSTGTIGILWSIVWFLLIFDSPAEHPRITVEEKTLIEEAIGATSSKGKAPPVPWRHLLLSAPVWAIVVTHGCSVYGYFTVVNQLPTYTDKILHYKIKDNGLLSSLPYLGKYLSAVAASHLADWIRQTGKLTTTTTRKIFTAIAVSGPGLLMLLQAQLGYDRVVSIVIFTAALTINGAVTGGYFSNGLDIAPNFSGTIFGMANTLSSIGGFLSSLMVGSLTQENQTYGQWQIVFWILAGIYFFGGVFFAVFGSGDLQFWNSPESHVTTKLESASAADENIPLKNGAKSNC